MTGDYRTGARILAALADAPMNAEALMHELDITRRGLGIAISYLVKSDAAPAPVVARGEPAAAPAPDQRAIADVVAQLTAPRASTAISVGDQVLQVLIAAGRITQDDIQLASKLIGSRA
jgi:hypothetical protein